ncbi:MAG: hypothetical protein ACXVUE_08205 [Solirubrobacteraceae bacterium]
MRRWPRLTPDIRTALALLGLLFYAVLRVAYSVFYNRFGLSPDDLGLSYVDLLVQSAVGTSVLLLLVVAGTSILFAEFVGIGAAWGDIRRARKGEPEYTWAAFLTTVVVVTGLGSAAADVIGLHAVSGAMLTVCAIVVAIWATIRGWIVIVRGVRRHDAGHPTRRRWWRWVFSL